MSPGELAKLEEEATLRPALLGAAFEALAARARREAESAVTP